jgi:hypothetical protein
MSSGGVIVVNSNSYAVTAKYFCTPGMSVVSVLLHTFTDMRLSMPTVQPSFPLGLQDYCTVKKKNYGKFRSIRYTGRHGLQQLGAGIFSNLWT